MCPWKSVFRNDSTSTCSDLTIAGSLTVDMSAPLSANEDFLESEQTGKNSSSFSFKESLAFPCHLDQQWRWREALAFFLPELLEARDDRLRAEGIRVCAQAAAERREAGAEDHREVELRGA